MGEWKNEKVEMNLRKKLCDILYQIINEESFCNKINKEETSGRIFFEMFDVFINLLQKPLDSSSDEKKNNPAHINMQK